MEKITKENAKKVAGNIASLFKASSYQGVKTDTQQAAAWQTVYQYCRQEGMVIGSESGLSPIENVISFISQLIELNGKCQELADKMYDKGFADGRERESISKKKEEEV